MKYTHKWHERQADRPASREGHRKVKMRLWIGKEKEVKRNNIKKRKSKNPEEFNKRNAQYVAKCKQKQKTENPEKFNKTNARYAAKYELKKKAENPEEFKIRKKVASEKSRLSAKEADEDTYNSINRKNRQFSRMQLNAR